jgi:hypothetical protein
VTEGPDPTLMTSVVVLTKDEAFRVCQVLADAGRSLLRSGQPHDADRLACVFDLVEERLVSGGARSIPSEACSQGRCAVGVTEGAVTEGAVTTRAATKEPAAHRLPVQAMTVRATLTRSTPSAVRTV